VEAGLPRDGVRLPAAVWARMQPKVILPSAPAAAPHLSAGSLVCSPRLCPLASGALFLRTASPSEVRTAACSQGLPSLIPAPGQLLRLRHDRHGQTLGSQPSQGDGRWANACPEQPPPGPSLRPQAEKLCFFLVFPYIARGRRWRKEKCRP